MNEEDYIITNPLKRELNEEDNMETIQEKKNKIEGESTIVENDNVNAGTQENENQEKVAFMNNNQGSVPEVTPVQINKQIRPGPKMKNDDTKPITNGKMLNISQSIEDGSNNTNNTATTTESTNNENNNNENGDNNNTLSEVKKEDGDNNMAVDPATTTTENDKEKQPEQEKEPEPKKE